MKTAVLIFGEYREFKNAHKTWKFLNNIDYDIYISTWNTSNDVNNVLGIDLHATIDETDILNYFPNAKISIKADTMYGMVSTKMIHHWRTLFNMMTVSDIEYDNVVLIRPDVYFDNTDLIESLLTKLPNENVLYGLSTVNHPPPPEYMYVNDCLFIGKMELMRNTFLSMFEPDITRKGIHYHLAKHFINNDIHIQPICESRSIHGVMRVLHRNYLHCNFIELQEIERIYFETKHMHPTNARIDELKLRLKQLQYE
jgi:hypothetical protein